jgi:hypothetical protein
MFISPLGRSPWLNTWVTYREVSKGKIGITLAKIIGITSAEDLCARKQREMWREAEQPIFAIEQKRFKGKNTANLVCENERKKNKSKKGVILHNSDANGFGGMVYDHGPNNYKATKS